MANRFTNFFTQTIPSIGKAISTAWNAPSNIGSTIGATAKDYFFNPSQPSLGQSYQQATAKPMSFPVTLNQQGGFVSPNQQPTGGVSGPPRLYSTINGQNFDQYGEPFNNGNTGNIQTASQNTQTANLGSNAGQSINFNGQTVGGYDSSGSPFVFGGVQQTSPATNFGGTPLNSTIDSTSLGNSTTRADINSRISKNLNSLDTMFSSLSSLGTVPQAELDMQQKAAQSAAAVTGLNAQAAGLYNPDNQAIALPFLQGQAQSKLVSAQLQNQINQAQLAYMQGNRQFAFNSASTIYNAARQNLMDTLQIYTQTAPQNLATNYNPTTGALNAVMRNPLTGEQYTANLGNIGAQRTFTSTNIATDTYTGALTFVGTMSDGTVVQQPIGGGASSFQGGSYNMGQSMQGGFGNNITGLTTPAAVNNNPGNLRDPQTGAWQVFSSPQEGFQALMSDIQGKQTGNTRTGLNGNSTLAQFTSVYAPASDGNNPAGYAQSIAKQLGVSVNTPIGQIPSASLAAAVAQHEDGRYWNAITSGVSNVSANVPPVVQKYLETLNNIPNSEYINSNRVPDNLKNAIKNMAGGVVPVLTDAEVSSVKSIATTATNLETMRDLSNKVLGSGALGRVGSSFTNWFDKTFQPNTPDSQTVARFRSFRETAVKNIQALAAGGSGLRINQAEIDTATANLPTIYDSKEVANAKIDQVLSFLQNTLQQVLPHAALASNQTQNSTQILDAILSQYK